MSRALLQNSFLTVYLELYQLIYCPRVAKCNQPANLDSSSSVLVLCMNDIGDFVIACRFIKRLRTLIPDGRITLVIKPVVKKLAEMVAELDDYVTIELTQGSRSWFKLDLLQDSRNLGRRLRARKFDIAYVLRCDSGGLMPCLVAVHSHAKSRVGFSYSSCSMVSPTEKVRERSLTHCVESLVAERESMRFERLLPVPVSEVVDHGVLFHVSSEIREAASELVPRKDHQLRMIGVALGANSGRRQWPAESFANVINQLEIEDYVVVLVGGPDDGDLAEQFKASCFGKIIDLVGKTALDLTVGVLTHCDVLLANDSGPAHLAEASGTDVLVVSCHPTSGDPMHNNSPERFGPVRPKSKVIRPASSRYPCEDACESSVPHCILSVGEQEVREALMQILSQTNI